MDMKNLLTQEKALTFLAKLGVENGLEKLQQNPRQFITDVVRAYQENVPFQCVTMMSLSVEERHVPTAEEIVAAGLSLEGGVCLTLNVFFCLLLRALGLKVDLLDGNYSAHGNDHSHVILLLSDLRFPGDNYVIDVGNGFPSMEIIPLEELPVTYYRAGLEYRYQYSGDDVIRLHRSGDTTLDGEKPVMRDDWRQVFHFRLHPVDFEHFRPHMKRIYIDDTCDFLHCIRAVRFPPEDALIQKGLLPREGGQKESEGSESRTEVGSSGDKRMMLAFKNQSLLVGPMDGATKTKVEEDVLAAKIKELFPYIPADRVDAAVQKIVQHS
ncbi:uncharacterized protein LOC122248468 [Penaeus japonicus]|uniref:uncharacterized protein LOC122248468 n=1 Tax=Penaeus japonicus TaxID=27405 RepID=UPI001C711B33|nr:uncharacterized protein LOC122248468 [Penaeus japonicus]XP_042864418.1 uncharacterized protein LOC122248468 [Penaeus japonicus]